MKVINTATGEIIAEITANHSMSIDDVITLMHWTIDVFGNLYDERGWIGYYDDIDLVV